MAPARPRRRLLAAGVDILVLALVYCVAFFITVLIAEQLFIRSELAYQHFVVVVAGSLVLIWSLQELHEEALRQSDGWAWSYALPVAQCQVARALCFVGRSSTCFCSWWWGRSRLRASPTC